MPRQTKQQKAESAAEFGQRCPESKPVENRRNGEVVTYRCMFQEGHVGTHVGSEMDAKGNRRRKTWV